MKAFPFYYLLKTNIIEKPLLGVAFLMYWTLALQALYG